MQKPGDLPERSFCSLRTPRARVFRPPHGINFLFQRSRRQPVAFAWQKGDGILCFQFKVGDYYSLRSFGALCASAANLAPKIFTAETRRTRRGRRESSRVLLTLILSIGLLSACSRSVRQASSDAGQPREVIDEGGRRVRLPQRIDRIVSLAPNLTEIVYAVGAGDNLVGDTEYCDYPEAAKRVAKIGDTMHPSVERIIALKPQIVLVSTASQLEAFTKQLDDQKIAVYVTNPRSLDEVFRSIETLGELFGHYEQAATLVADLRRRAATVEVAMRAVKPVKTFYQVSGEPLYTIGRDAYLTDLVRRAGGVSVTAEVPGGFPRFSDEAALAARPEAIILPSGGSMGTANSTAAASLKDSPAVLNNRVYKINDDHLSRPGPRLLDGLEELARALHPEAFK
jgi:iron complex transport system substrate-binding protein